MTELIEVAIAIMIIGVVLYAWIFAGSELEEAADVTGGSHWNNITNNTADMGEKGTSMLSIGLMLLAIFAAVGFLVFPYIRRAGGGGSAKSVIGVMLAKFRKNDKGTAQELIEVAIGIMIIGVILYAWVFAGSELEDAADTTAGTTWATQEDTVGDMGEKGSSMLVIGIILLAIFAAVGFLVYPYIRRAMP
jgi:hypothetical protein